MPFTFNGFGTRFYGRGDPDIDDSFTCTEWVVLAFIPILPIGSYRVMAEEDAGRSFGLGGFMYSSRGYTVIEKLSICWPQVRRVYGFMAGTLLWWLFWMGIFLPWVHVTAGLEPASPASLHVAFIFLMLAGMAAPFIFMWWLRRQAEKKAMLAAMAEPDGAAEPGTPEAVSSGPIATMRKLGVKFATPSGWSCESLPEHNGILLLAPEAEGGYQANLFLEVKPHGKTTLLAAAQQLSQNLRQLKTNYQEVAVQEGRTRVSLPWASVECTHDREQLSLGETHFIVQLHTGNWLIISASILSSHDSKYRPVIWTFLDSICA